MRQRIFTLFALFFALSFLGAACTLLGGEKGGSLFKSINGGKEWLSKSSMLLSKGRTVRLANLDITKISIDRYDSNRIFMGTRGHGLFASENGAEQWMQILPGERIQDIVLDPNARCALYVVTPSRVMKTIDCGQRWEVIYNETRTAVPLTSLALDPFSSNVLYLATAAGDVFRSADNGSTWLVQSRLENVAAEKILIDQRDPVILFLAGRNGTLYRSSNKGTSWKDISEPLKKYPESAEYIALEFLSGKDGLFYASKQGLFKTKDGGGTWEKIPLLVPSTGRGADILVATVPPQSDQAFFYATKKTLYQTRDNGYQWVSQEIPSERVPSAFIVDPNNQAILYLGVRTVAESAKYWYTPQQQ